MCVCVRVQSARCVSVCGCTCVFSLLRCEFMAVGAICGVIGRVSGQ